ncbi:transposase, partial [Arthrobacter sp. N199823]|uniref:transposase n=1 Tax=Arthrobacter sp. N199823 TaxID=2058895 RepID=UPI0015E35B74
DAGKSRGEDSDEDQDGPATEAAEDLAVGGAGDPESLAVYGDAAYGAGAFLVELEAAGSGVFVKVQPPVAPGGRYAKDRFIIDICAGTVSCPAGISVPIRPAKAGGGTAAFGAAGAGCPLAADCTLSKSGRTISISRYEAELVRARETQKHPVWREGYRGTRPKVERKIGHLMRQKHGGRRARVRGRAKVKADFSLLAAAVNIARLGMLKISKIATSRPAHTALVLA